MKLYFYSVDCEPDQGS